MDHDWQSPTEVAKWLRSKGFRQKGSGAFSAAFVHPSYPRIVKISKKRDVCWLQFAHWTLKMTSHPNVPYIDWVRRYGEDDKFFIAVIEKLAPFNKNAIMNTVDVQGLAYLFVYEKWFQNDKRIYARLAKEGIIQDKNKRAIPQVKKWLEDAKGGKRFINILHGSQRDSVRIVWGLTACSADIHDGNFMYRPSDKHLVVTDPLADLSTVAMWARSW